MKAMEKDRTRRYETANGLTMDIKRYLHDEPVVARPPSTLYRFSKLVRRNKVVFATTGAVATALLVGLTAAVWGLAEAHRQRDASTLAQLEAEQQRDDAAEARQNAIQDREVADDARQQAAARAEDLARRIYLIHIANADRALVDNNYVHARAELDACPHEHRGWEWHYLVERIRATIPRVFPGSENPIFTRDGKRLIATGALGTPEERLACVWETSSGKLAKTLRHDSPVSHLALSPNEKHLAGGDEDGNLFVWNTETGEKLWFNKIHESRFTGLAFSPDGRLIASANEDRRLIVVDARNGEVQFTIGPLEDFLRKVMFSPDGRWISAGMMDEERAMLVDVEKETIATRFLNGHKIPTFHPTGREIATGNEEGWITIWNWDGKQLTPLRSWQASHKQVLALDFSIDGTRLASGDAANGVKVWATDTGHERARLDAGDLPYWLATDPVGDKVAFFTVSGGIRLWRYGGHKEGLTVKLLDGAAVASFSPDGLLVAASYASSNAIHMLSSERQIKVRQGQISVLDAAAGTDVSEIEGDLHSASWTTDRRQVVAVNDSQREIRVYDILTRKLTRALTGESDRALAGVAASGRHLVSVYMDGTIREWDLQSGEETGQFSSSSLHRGRRLMGVGISPDTAQVGVAFFREYTVGIWDVRAQSRVCSFAVPQQIARRITFSKDGGEVYVGGNGGWLTRLDIDSGQATKRFAGHVGSVLAIALKPTEDQIVSGDDYGRVIVWDAASAQPLVTLADAGQPVFSLDWSSDGSRIVAGKGDGTVQIWTLPSLP